MFTSSKDAKLDNAKDGLGEGRHPIEEGTNAANHFGHDVHVAAVAVKEDMEDVAQRAGNHVRELADTAGHSLKGAEQALTTKIRDNPVQSSLLALGLGLLVGKFFNRS